MNIWNCSICTNYNGTCLKSLIRHKSCVHSSSIIFSCSCPVPSCYRKFQKFDTLYRHVKKDHTDLYDNGHKHHHQQQQQEQLEMQKQQLYADADGVIAGNNTVSSDYINDETPSMSTDTDMEDEIYVDNENNLEEIAHHSNLTENCAANSDMADDMSHQMRLDALDMVLFLKAGKITQTVVYQVIKSSSKLVGDSITKCTEIAIEQLRKASVSNEIIERVREETDTIINPFFGLESKYLQDKFMNDHLLLIKPKEILLGHSLQAKSKNSVSSLEEIPETSIYISVIETLQEMLSNENLAKELLHLEEHITTGIYYDITDGKYFKQIPKNATCFYILIFQDALEVCNPLGNRSGKHKIVMFYWTLVNISPKFRSRLSSMRLFAMVKRKVLDKYDFGSVMAPFFKEMDQLSEGVDFMIGLEKTRCYGKVLLCLGDTEGQHQIGGFKVGIGFSLRKCRMCYATEQDVRNNFNPDCFESRSKETYLRDCKLINEAPNIKVREDLSTSFGINQQSCLLRLKDFDITKQLPHDIMHVLLEGVVPYECQLVLSTFIDQRIFTLEQFNHRLHTFPFTYVDARSKPEPLKKSVFITGERKLKYSAENARIFLKIVPFILQHFVDLNDVFFNFLIDLSYIVHIAFSPVIAEGSCYFLEQLIISHLRTFKELFPDHHLIPKHHYLLEIPRMIPFIGPPIRYSCMRFEALHKIFKSFVPVINFRTLCVSLATKYLKFFLEDVRGSGEHSILKSARLDGPAKMLSMQQRCLLRNKFDDFPDDPFVYSLNWIVYYGTKFTAGKCIVAVDADIETQLPIFGFLKQILLCGDSIKLLVNAFETQRFEEKFIGYSVIATDLELIFSLTELLDFNVYQTVKTVEGYDVIPLKYDLSDIAAEHIKSTNPLHEISDRESCLL